jgi:tetratricopeptide (TPR) repeat protein
VDAEAFRCLATPDHPEHDTAKALALWQGEPLADAELAGLLRFHAWWTAEREALMGLHRQALCARVDQLWPSPSEALGAARSLVTHYPHHEWGHARVAQALKRTGRLPEAQAYIDATRRALSLELDLPQTAVLVDIPPEPQDKAARPAQRRAAVRPKLDVLPLQVLPQEQALQATAMHIASAITHGLWQSGVCDVEERDGQLCCGQTPIPKVSYVVHGNLTQLDGKTRLAVYCTERQSGTVLWSARLGSDRLSGPLLAGWIGQTVGAIQSLIRTAEMHRALEDSGGREQGIHGLLLEALALSSALEPISNGRALSLLSAVLDEAPDEPQGLALAAWCHAQRCIYNWSTNPDGDRGDTERFTTAATRLGANDPTCLTVLGAARSQIADQTGACVLLGRALQLSPHSSWAHARSGYVAIYQDQPERAARHFRASLQLAPRDPAVFNSMTGLGMAHFIKGEYKQAIEWMEKGLVLNPRATWICRNLAPAYVAAGRHADAERCVGALLDQHPDLSVAAVYDAMVMSRPTMDRVADGLAQAGLPRS